MRVLINWIVLCENWTILLWKFGTHYAYFIVDFQKGNLSVVQANVLENWMYSV